MTKRKARWIRTRSCQLKQKRTRKSAKLRVRQLRRTGDKRIGKYRCPFCHCFHIGHRRERSRDLAREAARVLGVAE